MVFRNDRRYCRLVCILVLYTNAATIKLLLLLDVLCTNNYDVYITAVSYACLCKM